MKQPKPPTKSYTCGYHGCQVKVDLPAKMAVADLDVRCPKHALGGLWSGRSN